MRAVIDAARVRAWDTATGKPVSGAIPINWGKESKGLRGVASTLAGNRAVWVTQPIDRAAPDRVDPKAVSTAYTFDLTNGREISRVQFTGRVEFDVLPHMTWAATVSAGGEYLAVAPEESKTVEVFDLTTGKRLHALAITGAEPRLHIAPDCKCLYVFEYKQPLRRFELVSGKELPAVAGTEPDVWQFEASADGRTLATLEWIKKKGANGREESEGFLTMRDTVANKSRGRLPLDATPLDFGFAGPDAVIVLAAKYRQGFPPLYRFSRWNAVTLKREWEVEVPSLPDKFSRRIFVAPNGKQFAFTNYQDFLHLYDTATGKIVLEPSGHKTWVSWVGFSPDGERVTTLAPDGVRAWTPTGVLKRSTSLPELTRGRSDATLLGEHLVWVTKAEDGKPAELVGWDRAKGAIGWRMPVENDGPERVLTPDGKRCVGVSLNVSKRVWDVTVYDGPGGKKLPAWTTDLLASKGRGRFPAVALSADGITLFVAGDGIVGLDAVTGKEVLKIDAGKFEQTDGPAAFPMAVSGDGKRIAVIRGEPRRGHVLRVFEIKSGKELAAHTLGAMHHPALRFSPTGKQVAVWNVWDAAVRVCDADTSETPVRKLDSAGSRATCAAFSPNGATLAVGYRDGTALLWDLTAK